MATNFDARLARYSAPALSLFRIVFGLLYVVHGTQKLFNWPVASPVPIGVGSWPGWWAGIIETACGLLITVGLFTRIAAFIASGEMAVAYFWMHWPPLQGAPATFWPLANGGEPAVMNCFAFLLLAALGAGAWSVDARRRAGVARAPAGAAAARRAAPPARVGLLGRLRGRRY
jgi:putative oxidoreductase